jgi:hypothetical protein
MAPPNSGTATVEQMWTSLLVSTSTRARPVTNSNDNDDSYPDGNVTDQRTLRLRLFVLSNLLDCAVQHTNLEQRRTHITRIMNLPKGVQKTLMALIEKRNPGMTTSSSTTTTSRNDRNGSSEKHAIASYPPVASATPPRTTTGRDGIGTLTPSRSNGFGRELSPLKSAMKKASPGTSSAASTPVASNTTPNRDTTPDYTRRVRINDPKTDESVEVTPVFHSTSTMSNHSTSGSGIINRTTITMTPTPPTRECMDTLGAPSSSVTPPTLSTMLSSSSTIAQSASSSASLNIESPATNKAGVETISELRLNISQLEDQLRQQKDREIETEDREQEKEARFRHQLLQMERQAFDRAAEQHELYQEQIANLRAQLETLEKEVAEGRKAQRELKQARDEMDVLQHHKQVLHETTEKLRKYKDKVTELQDVREALQQEQEAHGRAVDEIVRLENAVNGLEPVKRQVEQYKMRAIEAEVKLVECQDYLSRLEQKVSDQSLAEEHYFRGSFLQQEQIDDLQRRIQEETQNEINSAGVGNGVSELNPTIQAELIRLRNENLQLRAFAAKRQTDGIRELEESLDDAKQLADRFKQEFLATKETLTQTQKMLYDSKQKESQKCVEVEQLKTLVRQSEEQSTNLSTDLQKSQTESAQAWEALKETESMLTSTQQVVAQRESEVSQLREQLQNAHHNSSLYEAENTDLRQDLERVHQILGDVQERGDTLRKEVDVWKGKLSEASEQISQRDSALHVAWREQEQTSKEVKNLRESVQELENNTLTLENQINALQIRENTLSEELEQAQERLSDSTMLISQVQKREAQLEQRFAELLAEKRALEEKIERDHQLYHEKLSNADREHKENAELQENRFRREMDDLRHKMNERIDDERRVNRENQADADRKYASLENQWQRDYRNTEQRLNSLVEQSKQEGQDRIAFLQTEHKEAMNILLEECETKCGKLERQFQHEYQKLEERFNTTVDQCKKDAQEKLWSFESKHKEEVALARSESENKMNDLVRKGKAMLQEAKERFVEEMSALDQERRQLEERLSTSLQERQDIETGLRAKISTFKQQLEFSTNRVNDLTCEKDDLQDKIKSLVKEMHKVQDDNDRYQRQVGGRFQNDGIASLGHVDQLQKEYSVVLEENRNLKRQIHQRNSTGGIIGVAEASTSNVDATDSRGSAFSRGGISAAMLTQMRQEYEDALDRLRDEKRDLIMKSTAATAEVQKAEQRAWEHEQNNVKLRSEITSLQLAIQRSDLSVHQSVSDQSQDPFEDNRSPRELSFFSALADESSPTRGRAMREGSPYQQSPGGSSSGILRAGSSPGNVTSSPSIDRAIRQRNERESALRNRLQSLTSRSALPMSPSFPSRNSSQQAHQPLSLIQSSVSAPSASALSSQIGGSGFRILKVDTPENIREDHSQSLTMSSFDQGHQLQQSGLQESPRAALAANVFNLGSNRFQNQHYASHHHHLNNGGGKQGNVDSAPKSNGESARSMMMMGATASPRKTLIDYASSVGTTTANETEGECKQS